MTTPTKHEVDEMTANALNELSVGDMDLLAEGLEMREEWRQKSGLDQRSYALVKLAALVALDAPPASYQWQVANAMAVGVSAKDILGMLFAIAPQVGGPRVIAAAPEIMLALGLPLPGDSAGSCPAGARRPGPGGVLAAAPLTAARRRDHGSPRVIRTSSFGGEAGKPWPCHGDGRDAVCARVDSRRNARYRWVSVTTVEMN